jgi:hypothetical protein
MLCLVDLQVGERLYLPTVSNDYMLRTAITSSIVRTGVPPHNPYFFPGRPVSLRYHYFWMMPYALAVQMGKGAITPRHAVLAGTLWAGIGLIALITLYLRFFQPKGPAKLDRRMLIGITLLSVTGLDILPVAALGMLSHLLGGIEWWNPSGQVLAWVTSVFWGPHYAAGLTACFTGFLIIWHVSRSNGMANPVFAGAVAGLAFASAIGLSIYVAFVFATFLSVWLVILLLRKQWRDALVVCVSGMVALAAASPYLYELLGIGGTGNASEAPVQLAVRSFQMVDILAASRGWNVTLVNILALPLNYFMEFGFFFVIGVMQWRKMRGTGHFFHHKELCGFTIAATSILLCTFLRSSVISNNDLGWRGISVAQFILLIWATELWDDGVLFSGIDSVSGSRRLISRDDRRRLIAFMLVLGMAGSLYELFMGRFFLLISDASKNPVYFVIYRRNIGKRTDALRQVYESLDKMLPQNAIVQHNPNAEPGDVFYGLYADRQAAAETSGCGVVFGGDPALCPGIIGPINDLFEKPGAVDPGRVDGICHDLSIDALVVKDTDKVWTDKSSWVWKKQPDLANDYARVFLCGKSKAGPP